MPKILSSVFRICGIFEYLVSMILNEHIYERIVAAKLFIDDHFHEPISLDHISREACFSRFHFHRLFTRIYRRTPHQYLRLKRIELAGKLLGDQSLSIMDVCNSVGFESVGSFSGLFKKETGLAPRQYRHKLIYREKKARDFPAEFIPSCFANAWQRDKSNNEENRPAQSQ